MVKDKVEGKKRGRPKKQNKKIVEPKIEKVEKKDIKIKEVEEVVVATPKIRALLRLTHKSVTYEPGDIFEESDPEMVKQILNKKLGEIV